MLTHSYANFWLHFYPFGNTAAVSLTQTLPPEKQPASVLLLGCGDVRNILFSIHSDPGRKLDITCCDIETAIIARNVLLLTLILDDKDGLKSEDNWDIYYHLQLSSSCIGPLREQAIKLRDLSTSLNVWRNSKYGKLMRFCDEGTVSRVNKMWAFYAASAHDNLADCRDLRAKLSKVQAARAHKNGGSVVVMNSIRSASPVSVLAMHDHPDHDLHNNFWNHGSTYISDNDIQLARYPNPMVLTPDPAVIIQYGSDPFPGFHLSTAYAPLQAKSPLAHDFRRVSRYGRAAAAARAEFSAWSDSFRQHARNNITLRFCVADALAFSHTLRAHQEGGGEFSLYRKRNGTFDVLTLAKDDYCSGGAAPTSFDVIDTSNLVDHVGALNLLVATSPLLVKDNGSSLFTEVLVNQGSPDKHFMSNLICGHLPSIALLLGLSPVEYWTNTSTTTQCDQLMMDQIANRIKKLEGSSSGQLPTRIMWKRLYWQTGTQIIPGRLHMEVEDLAKVLVLVYQDTFPSENVDQLMTDLDLNAYRTSHDLDLPMNTRACFAAFVKLVKSRVASDWDSVMNRFLDRVSQSSVMRLTSPARLYLGELYAYLRVYEVFTATHLKPTSSTGSSSISDSKRYLLSMPPVVCVTLRVPLEALKLLIDENPTLVGTVPVHCSVDNAGIFAALQSGLGEMSTTGSRNSPEFQIRITDDKQGWHGKSDLFVSFLIATQTLIEQPTTTRIEFGVRLTSQTMRSFGPKLGLGMVLFGTSFNDHDHVFITKHFPNHIHPMRLASNDTEQSTQPEAEDAAVKSTITASISPQSNTTRLSTFTARTDILSSELRKALAGGSQVQVTPIPPCALSVVVGKERPFTVHFPAPIIVTSVKTRIARKSSWIELIAEIVKDPASAPLPSFTSPVFISSPANPNLPRNSSLTPPPSTTVSLPITPYLKLSKLPIIDLSKANGESFSWLNTHTTFMFSPRERHLRENPSHPLPASSKTQRTVVEFKDSLFSMFMQFPGIQGDKHNIFGITNPSNGGVHILFFVSSLRLDLASRSVVLDAAALPLFDELMPKLKSFLPALTGRRFVHIKVNDAELEMWKEMMPAMAERCREGWTHKAGRCGYAKAMKAPISTEVGEECICRCGNGQFPKGFKAEGVPMWENIKRYCTRVAISPLFANPLAERVSLLLSEFDSMSDRAFASQGRRGARPAFTGMVDDALAAADNGGNRNGGDGTVQSGCAKCGEEMSKNGQELKSCAKCRKVRYCSRECQKADWKAHKKDCGSTSS
ncbi:hypothetical protein QBC44DRAFT_267148 [Cladorrhinum sp. PSN332]|nr:hypothetical protein QBC44DRAFT_267148 [Cladorrhinum sp. PSN332]